MKEDESLLDYLPTPENPKETFIVRTEWFDALSDLSRNDRCIVFDNLFHYHMGNMHLVDLSKSSIKALWKLLVPGLKRNIKDYDKRRDTSGINGKKGGRPRKEEHENLNKPNAKPNNLIEPIETLPVPVLVLVPDPVLVPELKEPKGSPDLQSGNADPDLAKQYQKLIEPGKTVDAISGFIRDNNPKIIQPYVDLWNLFAKEHGKPIVKTITDERKRKLGVRVREAAFNFPDIITTAAQSNFLMTRSFFGFDWIVVNESNYVKILEGNYAGDQNQKSVEGTVRYINPQTGIADSMSIEQWEIVQARGSQLKALI